MAVADESCTDSINEHDDVESHRRHRQRRRASINHLRTYCDSLSASIAEDNEKGLQTIGLHLSKDNRDSLLTTISETQRLIESHEQQTDSIPEDFFEVEERSLARRASIVLLEGRVEVDEINVPQPQDVSSDPSSDQCDPLPAPAVLSPSDEGCPPFECPESRFPPQFCSNGNGYSNGGRSSSVTNANRPPEEWGMTVNQLNNFVSWCKSHPRWEWINSQYLRNKSNRCVSGYDISEFFVKPWTTARNTRAGVALHMNRDKPKRVNLFLSHAWAEDVEELVQSVNRHCQARKLDKNETVIWCCIFALYQNDDESQGLTIAQQVQMSPPPFEAGISASSTENGVLLCHTQHENVCNRLWCVFEIFKATSSADDFGYSAALHIGCSDAYSLRLLAIWKLGHHHIWLPRCRSAQCSMEEDREYITEEVERVKDGWMKVDSTVYLARMQLAKLGCYLDEQSRLNELDLLKFEREFSTRHTKRTFSANSSWIKLKAATGLITRLRKSIKQDTSMYNVTSKLRGIGDILPTEKSPHPNVWGHQNKEYNRSISPYVEVKKWVEKERANITKLTFSYKRVWTMDRVLPRDMAEHLWSARPYHRSGPSTAMPSLSGAQLFQMCFGIKQHGKFYLQGERYFTGDYYDYQIEGDQIPPEKYPVPDIPNRLSYHSGTIQNCTGKRGRGMKVHNYGPNSVIDVVVTRYDEHGNLQMMTMVRPDDAVDSIGEFQLTSGCLFFGSEHGFETQVKDADGHLVDRQGPPRMVTQAKGPVPFRLVSSSNVDRTGKIQNKAVVYARAAIVEKHFYNESQTADVHDAVGSWNFYKLASGMVDTVYNTDEAWVETSIVVHHITGHEGADELSLFKTSAPPPGRMNAGLGIWRSIESAPKEVHTSQYAFVDERTGEIQHRSIPVKQPYDPYVEFDLWHGDHSFMAAMVGDFVKMHYCYEGPAEFGFGKSKCSQPYALDMIEDNSILQQNTRCSAPKIGNGVSRMVRPKQIKSYKEVLLGV